MAKVDIVFGGALALIGAGLGALGLAVALYGVYRIVSGRLGKVCRRG